MGHQQIKPRIKAICQQVTGKVQADMKSTSQKSNGGPPANYKLQEAKDFLPWILFHSPNLSAVHPQ